MEEAPVRTAGIGAPRLRAPHPPGARLPRVARHYPRGEEDLAAVESQFRAVTLNQLAAISSDLRIHLQAAPYRGPEGMALRGFYVDKTPKMLKHPLIYLNTAHDPAAVSMTFMHEMGHHVTAKVTGRAGDGVHYFFNAAHRGHLGQPEELAADVIASLAAYPQPLARRIFATPCDWGLVARADLLPDRAFAQIRKHVQKLGGS